MKIVARRFGHGVSLPIYELQPIPISPPKEIHVISIVCRNYCILCMEVMGTHRAPRKIVTLDSKKIKSQNQYRNRAKLINCVQHKTNGCVPSTFFDWTGLRIAIFKW